ncbi:diacylglycerol kinase [Helicobacter sp. MIT 14-3879]|nr:diacylglycerol kinase [Helicobacter sp. MIT 14-3879]RDU60916.1 diacylglycerol kinase [Helicobacter sp. MIT 14-3879]
MRNMQKGKTGFNRIYHAFFYSLDGIKAAFIEEEGFRQVFIISLVNFVMGVWLGNGFSQKILLILPGFLCVIIELFNSAIENAIDHTSLDLHPFAKKAKDMGSAAQMLGLGFLLLVWGIFLWLEFLQ